MENLNILALTLGENTPSSRFRVRKLTPELTRFNINVDELYAKYGSYPPAGSINRLGWLPLALKDAYLRVRKSKDYDLCLVQKPLLSTLITFEPFIRKPFIFDVDDAVHLGKRGGLINKIAQKSAHVICGNQFLAEHYSKFAEVTILPTAVDTGYFYPQKTKDDRLTIGWSGSSSGFKYLYNIEAQLLEVLNRHSEACIKIVSNEPPKFKLIDPTRIIFEKWTSDTEVQAIQDFSVGLMPLDDNQWERGKCSYKMLTYMSVGVPVVVSDVGMNISVMSHGESGYLASTPSDWIEAISELLNSQSLREKMGGIGRKVVCEHYSNNVIVPQLTRVIRNICK
ncbi:glycosyltransferase [Aliikangiella maris]|uniref:Glycosyltransferase n=2 Tax=Aliikangiella maris TaxID=3162458 RepID=A0ABV3MHY1_9GAMM